MGVVVLKYKKSLSGKEKGSVSLAIQVAQTRFGAVSGIEKDGITAFCGIPYAAPPVGALRWRAPQPPEKWAGVRVCDRFSDMCIQNKGFVGMDAFLHHPQSEDCLYLNIWTPAKSPEEKLPVHFWIHGGGFQGGLGDEPLYQGLSLVAQGEILVTINYRLGALGFMAHPALTAEDENHSSGNFGLLDQIAALRWVKQNIGAFGGDSRRITINGQSAGGMSVAALLTTPLTSGLYSGAILQSGGPRPSCLSLEDAEKDGVSLQNALHCKTIDELRALPPAEILAATRPAPGALRYRPVLDGYVLSKEPYDAICAGRIAQVPLVIGSNADEGLFAPVNGGDFAAFSADAKRYFGADYAEFCELYNFTPENFARASLDVQRDFAYVNIHTVLEKLQKTHPCPVYQYYFEEPIRLLDGTVVGATHSAELFYVFGTLDVLGGSTTEGKPMAVIKEKPQYALSDKMGRYWVSFVQNGDPNAPDLPLWETAENGAMHFKAENVRFAQTQYPRRICFLKKHLN